MNTKVILVRDVKNLGEEGDIKEVARGYARNYLLPRKFVVPHNKGNLAMIAGRRAAIEKKKEEKRGTALGLKERIEALTMKIVMPMGDNGKLFGSVTSAAIADELGRMGIAIERKRVEVPGHTIKSQGNYKIKVRLYENQEATLNVAVNPKEEKAAADASAPAAPAAETAQPPAPGGEAPVAEAAQSPGGEAPTAEAAQPPAEEAPAPEPAID
ncbi:MAG: 50S ribosomal protein L9 [Spirochaetia bacterium]|jgi:large subunit ribosomal protein L9|nr:50S ribosomal protein L9 [Spirochaetia bacterium]